MMEVGFAQTNLELFGQLSGQDWPPGAVAESARCYRLSVDLMASAYRQSGKHFLHHLVGTASILGWCHQPAAIVNAGLLHAIYDLGDFGAIRDRREFVRKVAGAEVEEIVWRYHNLTWSAAVVRQLASGDRPIDSVDEDLLIMRLANHLEDHLDQGMLYYPGAGKREGRRPDLASDLIYLAEVVDRHDLAEAMDSAFEADAQVHLPDSLRARGVRTQYFAPMNTAIRPTVALRRSPALLKSKMKGIAKRIRRRRSSS